MSKYKTFEELKEELGDNYDKLMYEMNLELVKQKEKAIEFNQIVLNSDYVYLQDEIAQKNLNILQGEDKDVKD